MDAEPRTDHPPGQEPLDLGDVLAEYADVFAELKDLPPWRSVNHRIELQPGSVPPKCPVYRMAPAELAELEKQVRDLLVRGLIRPSTSPYASPVLFVTKKDGSKRSNCPPCTLR